MMMVSAFFKPSASSMPCSAVNPVIGIAPACRRSQSPRDRRGLVGGHHDIFRVKAALRVLPVVGIDFIADFQPPHPRADRSDNAGAVKAENERKMRFAAGIIPFPDIGVPSANARGIDG